MYSPVVLFISGPTACGKTDYSLRISNAISSEIINADMGQFYEPLTVGTAKPDWKNSPVTHHMFDILDRPKDLNVCVYRMLLFEKIQEVCARGKVAIVVGGSIFYLKSLFYPPLEYDGSVSINHVNYSEEASWDLLNSIDPVRAAQIHPNDAYRIARALDIWKQTGKKPSELQPVFDFPFKFLFLFIDLPRNVLYERINLRTKQMIAGNGGESWIDEVRRLRGTEWEPFLKRKKLIGYSEIFEWLDRGGKREELDSLVADIQAATRQYAKRQGVFWKKFGPQLEQACKSEKNLSAVINCLPADQASFDVVFRRLKTIF